MSVFELIIIFLLVANLAAVGAVLLRRKEKKPEIAAPTAAAQLPEDEMAKLRADTKAAFEFAVNDAAQKFHGDLTATSQNLNQLILKLTTEVVERELEEYRKGLADARNSAIGSLEAMQKAIDEKKVSLEADLDGELAKRREELMAKLDTRLGQAVSAYIVESLGQGADLGAQKTFLLQSLERNKEMLKKDLIDGV